MYINTITNDYPYGEWHLRRDNPQTSFPEVIPEQLLREFSVLPVVQVQKPEAAAGNIARELPPEFIDGQWTQRWVVEPKTAEQIESDAQSVRAQRGQLLIASDWTQLPDAPVAQSAWAAYRQALRDIPSQQGFPWDIQWPIQPE